MSQLRDAERAHTNRAGALERTSCDVATASSASACKSACESALASSPSPTSPPASTGSPTRIPWIDLAKGAGIFLVAMGHLTNGASEGVWLPALNSMHFALYLFHMPLFFVLGGMVLQPHGRSLQEFAASRARTLLVCYYVFSLYFLAKPLLLTTVPSLAAAFGLEPGAADLADTVWHVLVMGEGLWFCWAYFWAELVAFVVVSKLELGEEGAASKVSMLGRTAALVLGCLLAALTQAFHVVNSDFALPFQLLRGLWGAGYVLVGWSLQDVIRRGAHGHASLLGVACLMAFVVLDLQLRGLREPALWGVLINNGTHGLTSGAVSLLAALLGSLAVVALARAGERCLPLEAVGRESLAYYALSPLVMNACKFVLFGLLGVSLVDAPDALQLVAGLALALASVVLSAPLVILLRRLVPLAFGSHTSKIE